MLSLEGTVPRKQSLVIGGLFCTGAAVLRFVLSRFKGKRANLNSVFYLKGSNRTKKTCMEIRLKKQTNKYW